MYSIVPFLESRWLRFGYGLILTCVNKYLKLNASKTSVRALYPPNG